MTFPLYIPLGPWHVHPHALFDLLAYAAGGQLYWLLRRRRPTSAVPFEKMMWVFVFMAGGALFGAKVLAWLEMWPEFWAQRFGVGIWLGGKTIAGGILGGWLGVELGKKMVGPSESTGDAFVFPLILAIAIGRLGCFLTGLSDHTYGIASSLPWAIDFGDGIPRHPTSLYEIAILLIAGAILWTVHRRGTLPNGAIFRLFIAIYCLFRLLVEFIKPREVILAGLCPIQWASAVGAIAALISLRLMLTRQQRIPQYAAREEVAP